MPLITVIIPTYNRADVINRAVNSVLSQSFRNYELIVIDDGSTDNTQTILDGYNEHLICFRQDNKGVSAARNLGLRKSSGELVCFLDSDDEWLPTKLERQVSMYDGNADFIVHTEEIWLRNGKAVKPKSYHRKQSGRFFDRALELCLISPSSVMMTKSLLDRVGWFDEDLPAAEDYDLWLRITSRFDVSFLDEPLIIKHAGHPNQLSFNTPAIDRFRVKSILNILRSGELSSEYRDLAIDALSRKCRIVASGCMKKGKYEEAKKYLGLAAQYHTGRN